VTAVFLSDSGRYKASSALTLTITSVNKIQPCRSNCLGTGDSTTDG